MKKASNKSVAKTGLEFFLCNQLQAIIQFSTVLPAILSVCINPIRFFSKYA